MREKNFSSRGSADKFILSVTRQGYSPRLYASTEQHWKHFKSRPNAESFFESVLESGESADLFKRFHTITPYGSKPYRQAFYSVAYTVTTYVVRYAKATGHWISLRDRLNEIKKEYELEEPGDQPADFLSWANVQNNFWSWARKYPPYRGLGYFVKVEVWYVIYNQREEQNELRSMSRARGLAAGVSWDEVIQVKDELERDVTELIERKDYLELQGFVGWSAYPEADWYIKRIKYLRDAYK